MVFGILKYAVWQQVLVCIFGRALAAVESHC